MQPKFKENFLSHLTFFITLYRGFKHYRAVLLKKRILATFQADMNQGRSVKLKQDFLTNQRHDDGKVYERHKIKVK